MYNLWTGTTGTGKTAQAVEKLKPLIERDNLRVWSNVKLRPNRKDARIKYYEELEDIADECRGTKEDPVILFIDEQSTPLDPYDWERTPKKVKKLFQQHRKRHISIFATAQHSSLVAKSARIVVDNWVDCEILTPTEGKFGTRGIGYYLPLLIFSYQYMNRRDLLKEEPEKRQNLLDWLGSLRIVLKSKFKNKQGDAYYDTDAEVDVPEKLSIQKNFKRCEGCGHETLMR